MERIPIQRRKVISVRESVSLIKQKLHEYKQSDDYDCNDLADYLQENSDCDEYMDNLFQFTTNLNEKRFKANAKWLVMDLKEWTSCCNHPCPIITMNNSVKINNYSSNPKFNQKIYQYNNIDLDTACHCYYENNVYKHADKSYAHLIGSQTINATKWTTTSINEILSKGVGGAYLLIFISDHHARFNVIFRVCSINNYNMNTRKTKVIGTKCKLYIIIPMHHWITYNDELKSWHYQLSFHLAQLLLTQNTYIVGNEHYYYQYEAQHLVDETNQKKYYYFRYLPEKPLKSVEAYYSKYYLSNTHKQNIIKQQNEASPSHIKITKCTKKKLFDYRFWLGIVIKENVIDMYWKNEIKTEILQWKKNGKPPEGIVKGETKSYRDKYFVGMSYIYKTDDISWKQLSKEQKIANGLRIIPNVVWPKWLIRLINHLKFVKKFIDPSVNINQIGINCYFNDTDKTATSQISAHNEGKKFSVVYDLSIYSNPSNKSAISYGLHMNKSNGDTKIYLNDCSGFEMQS